MTAHAVRTLARDPLRSGWFLVFRRLCSRFSGGAAGSSASLPPAIVTANLRRHLSPSRGVWNSAVPDMATLLTGVAEGVAGLRPARRHRVSFSTQWGVL
jgi:hypothetical protein